MEASIDYYFTWKVEFQKNLFLEVSKYFELTETIICLLIKRVHMFYYFIKKVTHIIFWCNSLAAASPKQSTTNRSGTRCSEILTEKGGL